MYFLPIPICVHLDRCALEHSLPRRESILELAEARFHLYKCLGRGEEKGGIASIDIRRKIERSYPRNIRICRVNEHVNIKDLSIVALRVNQETSARRLRIRISCDFSWSVRLTSRERRRSMSVSVKREVNVPNLSRLRFVFCLMPPKRRRQPSPAEKTKRSAPSDSKTSPWGWVGTEVKDVSALTTEHILATCGFSSRNSHSLCLNRFNNGPANDKLDNDIIVITDEETSQCSRKVCKNNPNCLNYLGQEKWEDNGESTFR